MTLTTGDLTAAADASAKTEPCATPSQEPATAPQGSRAGAARSAVTKGRMEMTAIKNASVKMEPPVTMWLESADVLLDTLVPCKQREYYNLGGG